MFKLFKVIEEIGKEEGLTEEQITEAKKEGGKLLRAHILGIVIGELVIIKLFG